MAPKNPFAAQGSAGQQQFKQNYGDFWRNYAEGKGQGINPDIDPRAGDVFGNFNENVTDMESIDPSSQYRGIAAGYRYMDAPDIDWSQRDAAVGLEGQSRGEQMGAMNAAQQAALGNAPSAAAIQGAGGIQSALASAFASGHGGAGAARGVDASGMGQDITSTVGGAAMGRGQEIAGARGLFGDTAAAMHGQDLQRRQQSAEEALYAAGLKNRAYLGYGKLGLGYEGVAEQGREGAMGRLQRGRLFNMATGEAKKKMAEDDATRWGQAGMGAGMGLMSAGLMSDIRAKADVAPTQPAVAQNYSAQNRDVEGQGKTIADAFLKSLSDSSSVYRYKDPQHEPRSQPTGGHYLGVMAQNVERVPEVGKQIVSERPDGMKTIEQKPMLSALAAAIGRLNQKVEEQRQPQGAGLEEMHQRALARSEEGNALVSDERAKQVAYQRGMMDGTAKTTQQFQQERSAARNPVNMDSAVSRTIFDSGMAAAKSGQPQIAAQQFEELGTHNQNPHTLAHAGHLYSQAGDTQSAERAYKAALATRPDEMTRKYVASETAKDTLSEQIDQEAERRKKKAAKVEE